MKFPVMLKTLGFFLRAARTSFKQSYVIRQHSQDLVVGSIWMLDDFGRFV